MNEFTEVVKPASDPFEQCSQHVEPGEAFMKFDDGKILMSLVDPQFVIGVARILTHGAEKYDKNNWKLNTDLDRYKDAFLRHSYAYLGGEYYDPDSGLPHLDHMACNIMFLRYFEEKFHA